MKASTNLRYGDRWKTICECMKSLVYRPFAKETYPILLLALMPGFIQRRIFTIHSYDKVADIKDVKTNREVNMGFSHLVIHCLNTMELMF